MGAHCIRHTELPHTSKLFADYLYDFERAAKYYDHRPFGLESFRQSASAIHYPDDRRAALAAAMERLNPGSPLLEKLATPGTVAVLTGQQVGLLSGPAYTLYKALAAVKLAAHLAAHGVPAVPIFWLATEDHDLAEINHVWLFDSGQHPFSVQADGENKLQMPVGNLEAGSLPLEPLNGNLHEFPFGGAVAAMIADAYRPGRTYGEAFRQLLRSLMGPMEILFVDPLDPAIRQIAAPFLERAVLKAATLKQQVIARSEELVGSGYHAQVHVEPDTSFLFLLRDGRRLTLHEKDGEFAAVDTHFTAAGLAADATHLSPNALLRPVTQDWIFPTVAYIGGPAELAYMAQSQVLYHTLLGRMPVVVPRAGFTLLDNRAVKLMERYGVTLPDAFHGSQHLHDHIARALIPPTLMDSYRQTRASVQQELDRLQTNLAAFDPTLVAALKKSCAKILYQLSKNERKIARETIRRDERATAAAAYLSDLLFPQKHLQERFYSIVPFLARHGVDLVSRIYENVQLDCPDHQLLTV